VPKFANIFLIAVHASFNGWTIATSIAISDFPYYLTFDHKEVYPSNKSPNLN
jgi:hypothetical protein